MREYAKEYFKILFLNILSKEAGKATVNYKRKLDKIKFRKNSLLDLFKMKYDYSTQIAAYNRYIRDDNWKQVLGNIGEIFHENDDSFRLVAKPRFISHSYFCNTAISGSKKISNDIKIIMAEFDEKEYILQNLSNYKNTKRSIHVNYLMLLIAAITLLFVVFPEQATKVAKVLKDIFCLLKSIISEMLKA